MDPFLRKGFQRLSDSPEAKKSKCLADEPSIPPTAFSLPSGSLDARALPDLHPSFDDEVDSPFHSSDTANHPSDSCIPDNSLVEEHRSGSPDVVDPPLTPLSSVFVNASNLRSSSEGSGQDMYSSPPIDTNNNPTDGVCFGVSFHEGLTHVSP